MGCADVRRCGADTRRRRAARAARSGYLGKSHRTIVRAQFVLVAVDANSSLVERVGVVFSLGSGLTKGAPEPFVPISC